MLCFCGGMSPLYLWSDDNSGRQMMRSIVMSLLNCGLRSPPFQRKIYKCLFELSYSEMIDNKLDDIILPQGVVDKEYRG